MSPSQSSASVRLSCTAWRGSGWSGTSIGPRTFSWQAAAPGNTAASRSSLCIRWRGGGTLLPAAEAQHDQAAVEVPPPAALEDRLVEDGLLQRGPDRGRAEEAGHVGEREAVVRPEGDDDGIVVGAGLELEVEPGAELLAQRVAQRPVEPAAVGRVDHQLHPARLVEEPLDDQVVLGGHDAEHGPGRRQVGDDGGGRVALDAGQLDDLVDRSGQVVVDHAPLHHRRGCVATSSLSSTVRAGASPRQNGIVGCLSPASTTRTSPPVTCRICQWCVPRMNTSPAIDSVAQSSFTLPIRVSSGSATTRKSPSSGMAPPLVRAASRAPLRPRSSPLTRSWWT